MDLLFIVLLLLVGMVLLVLELVAIPGTGIPGIAGVGLTIWGIYEVFAEYGSTWGFGVLIFEVVICVVLLAWSLRSKTWKKFSLEEKIDSKVNVVSSSIKVGDTGKSVTRLAPMGTAIINDERVEVFTTTSFVNPDTPLVVEQVEGNKIRVKALE